MSSAVALRGADSLKRFRSAGPAGDTAAIQVEDRPLVLTGQLLPFDSGGTIAGDGVVQVRQLLADLRLLLAETATAPGDVVRLNFYVADEKLGASISSAVADLFGDAAPTITTVQTGLTDERALVALDAVILRPASPDARPPASAGKSGVPWAILPAGRKVFVSGQAERDPDLAVAARRSLASLGRGLEHLGVRRSQVAHVKVFLGAAREHARVRQEIAAFLGGETIPPVVFVEWVSSVPIEIELVAAGPATGESTERLSLRGFPGMTDSPRYSRVAIVEPGSPLVFTSGVYGQGPRDARQEWQQIFAELGATLFAAGGSFRQLAKATYYNTEADGVKTLGEIRDVYYDPARPPAASAATVKGVGRPGKTAMLEMIAVPVATPGAAK